MRVKVRMLDAIAGLADPDKARLDAKYAALVLRLRSAEKAPSERAIAARIDELKLSDRYHEKPIGFKKDWAFAPGSEQMVDAELAAKWFESGIAEPVPEKKAA